MHNQSENQPNNPPANQYPNTAPTPIYNDGQPAYIPQPLPYLTYWVQDPNFLMQQHLQHQQQYSQWQQYQELCFARKEIEELRKVLNHYQSQELKLLENNQVLKNENEVLLQENIVLKRQMLETQPVSYNEDTNKLSLLTSSLSATRERPGVFEYQVLTLPSQSSPDLTLPLELPALRFRLEEEANSSEYFQQYVPFIMEEIRASIAGEMQKIKTHQLRPFTASFDPATRLTAGEYALKLICRTDDFPKLDHEFQNEAVFIAIKKTMSSTSAAEKWEAEEALEGFLAIASPSRHIPRNPHERQACTFSLLFLRDQYEKNADYWQNKGNIFEIHWLHGLIPAAREYEACIDPTSFSLESQIIRGNLPDWPDIEHTNPVFNTSPYASQNDVISSLENVQSGLYVLQGPPGTGKTTTIVALQDKWVNRYPNERILLCAPSNSAVQQVFTRAKLKLPDACMVVLGNPKNTLDNQAEAFVKQYAFNLFCPLQELLELPNNTAEELKAKLLLQYDRIFDKLYQLNHHERNAFVKGYVRNKVRDLVAYFLEKKTALRHPDTAPETAQLHANIQASIDTLKDNAHYLEYFLVQRAQIVFVTLTGSGRDFLKKQIPHFERLVIDEASQALTPTALIPLLHFNPNVCILVGDPKQLPATLISKNAQRSGYDTSLISYFIAQNQEDQEAYPYKMLTSQFRMHQDICLWPSQQYYASALETDASIFGRPPLFSPRRNSIFCHPALFFNIQGKETRQGHSFINEKEVTAIVATTIYLLQLGIKADQIGIITFYAAQASRILQELQYQLKKIPSELTVSTVDSFQGSERDFIMISTVRTKKDPGFLKDSHRINVSMTRAKHNLCLFGNANTIHQSNTDLASYIAHATVFQEKDLIAAINRR